MHLFYIIYIIFSIITYMNMYHQLLLNRRTQLSAQSLLSGFMPNITESIPIHTVPQEIEIYHPNHKSCPILDKIEEKIKNETRWKEYIDKNAEFKMKLDDYMGYPLSDYYYGYQK